MAQPFTPRRWQKEGAETCVSIALSGADRALIYACPGSGKTFGGLLVAQQLISRVRRTTTLLVVTPNLAIRSQWLGRSKLMGIELSEIADGRVLMQRQLPIGVQGFILNYQQALKIQHSLRAFCEEHRPVVVLDEVHHTAGSEASRDGNAWGHAMERSCAAASFKLCTTGTPFREGNNPIAFVHYNEEGEATAHVKYSYEQAIRDGVCRPIDFTFWGGSDISWRSKSGRFVSAGWEDRLTKKLTRERLEAALKTDGEFPIKMLAAAHERLMEIRQGSGVDAIAAGLVVAIDIPHANALADVLEEISGQRPVVVHSKLDDAQGLIDSFRDGNSPWIVGVSMLSEGVDIPRLRVGVYASRIRTALYFQQFCGRFTRVVASAQERAFVFCPDDPELRALALDIEKEKYHALGEDLPHREIAGSSGNRGNRQDIRVESSDGAAVSSAFGGVLFPTEYRREHQGLIGSLRREQPSLQNMPDVELLKLLINTKVIKPPTPKAA